MNITADLKPIFLSAFKKAISIEEYEVLLNRYAKEGRTSGLTQSESLINYTKLNAQRSKRVTKTLKLDEGLKQLILQINTPQTWLLITETWCGDAANSIPVILTLARLNPLIDIKVVFRDENPELMDQFLTNGGRSIPKLIALDQNLNVLFDWGPRPSEAQELFYNWRNAENKTPYEQFHIDIQKWYNSDLGYSIQSELKKLIFH